jgi:signal transduction histidine kinase
VTARPTSTPEQCEVVAERAELLSSISHELRTPLTSVIGYTEVLLGGDTGDLTDEQVAMLARIASNGARLLELIEGLLCAANDRNLHGATVDVSDVVLEVVRSACGGEDPVPTTESDGPRPTLSR